MSPLSSDPEKRQRQLANLPNTRGEPTAGSWKAGQPSPNLKHGLRSRRPGPLLGEAAAEIVDALADTVPLKGPDGQVLPQFVPAVESAALDLIVVKRVLGYLTTHGFEDERGRLRPEVDGLSKVNQRLQKALDRLGATPTSYARLGFDVARTGASLATAMSDPDPERRAELMREAGLDLGGGEDGGLA